MNKNRPQLVQRQTSNMQDLWYVVYGMILGVVVGLAGANLTSGNDAAVVAVTVPLACTLAVALVFGGRHLRINRLLRSRINEISLMASSRQPPWTFSQAPEFEPNEFSKCSITELCTDGYQWSNYVKTPNWSYADYSYDVYQQTKYGQYQSGTVYYGVVAVTLPRILPNVLFDSKRDRGHQFKALFSMDQIHVLEGNFSEYFTTYFAEEYAIDSMSFITPEVMEALIEAADYDIEIVGNQLLLYGLLYEPDLQITDMASKAEAINKKLMNNITVYRDDRLPAAVGAQTVTPTGMFLKRRGAHVTIGAILVVLYIILKLASIVTSNHH
jgi:hypothetical protein